MKGPFHRLPLGLRAGRLHGLGHDLVLDFDVGPYICSLGNIKLIHTR